MKQCRLLKSEIIRKKTEFNRVFSSVKILSANALTLRYTESSSRRIGFIVPKDIAPKAVIRNRIKRYLREIYRIHKEWFSENYDYVFQARAVAVNASFHEMKDEVLFLVQKINNDKK